MSQQSNAFKERQSKAGVISNYSLSKEVSLDEWLRWRSSST